MEVVAERRFQSKFYAALKKRLDSLRYCEPLGLESAPLVEKLLTDLIKTTEGFQQLKKQNSELNSKIKSLNESLVPLQNEVSVLMKKNNDLHLHLMSTKEDFDSKDSFWRASVRKLEAENGDLKFLAKKGKDDLARQESQNMDLRTRLDSLMSKSYASYKLPNGLADSSQGKNQGFELSRPLASGLASPFAKPDSVWANELRAADERTRKVQEELEVFRTGKVMFEDEIKRVESQLESRNLEILRLSAMVGADSKSELITKNYREGLNSANIEQLNDRVDFLNKENVKLENELVKVRQGQQRFFELEKENKCVVESLADLRTQNKNLNLKLAELERFGNRLGGGQEEILKAENSELCAKVRGLEQAIEGLREENSRGEMYKNAFNADKRAYSEAIEKIDQERESLKGKLIEFEGLIGQNQNELALSKEKEKMHLSQIANLRRELEATQQTYSKINKDHLSTTEETYQLRQKIAALESQKNITEAELETTIFELERISRLKKISEDQGEELKKDLIKCKNDFDLSTAQRQKLQLLYESSQKEINNLKDEASHLLKLREKDKQALMEAEDRQRDLNNQISGALHSNRVIQNEHQNISDELTSRLEEIRKINQYKSSIEQELAELRPLKLKYQQLIEESQNIRSSAMSKESSHLRMQKQIDSLEDSLRGKENHIKDLNNTIEKYREDLAKLENELESTQEHAALLNNNVKQTEYLHSETAAVKQQLNDYRDREREQLRTIEQLKAELKKAGEAVKNIQKQLQRTGEVKTNLENELEMLKERLGDMLTKDLSGQNENVKLEEKAFQAELQIEEMKRQVGHEQHNRYRLEDEVKHLQNVTENEKSQNQRLLEQNSQLKSLISNLEKMKEDLLKKIQHFNVDRNQDDEHKSQLIGEITQLRKEIAGKTSENLKLNEAIKGIDQERDYIQSLLDQKTEDFAALESSLIGMQKEGVLLKDSMSTLYNKEATSGKKLEEKDFQIKKLGEKCRHMESELEEIRGAYSQQSRQIQELNEHVVAITKENQYVNDQLMKTTHEKENLKKFYEDKTRNERASQQFARSVEREKEDLLLTYKKACEENDRLNQAISAMNIEQRETYAKLQACEQELVNAQNHIAQQDHGLFSLQQEISTLERQLSHLAFQLETAERKNQESYEMKESFLREVANARQVALNVESSKDDLIRKIASTENEKLILESKVRAMLTEISAVKSQAEFEKQRCDELQMVLAKERETLFKTQKDLGKLEMHKGHDEDIVHNQLQSTRNQVMNLEMELLKLKEENGKSNHKIHKYETKIQEMEGQLNKTSAAFRYADDWDS